MLLNSLGNFIRIRYPDIFKLPTTIRTANVQSVQIAVNRWNPGLLAFKKMYVLFISQACDAPTYQIFQFPEYVIAKYY